MGRLVNAWLWPLTGFLIGAVTSYGLTDWQWWVLVVWVAVLTSYCEYEVEQRLKRKFSAAIDVAEKNIITGLQRGYGVRHD